MRRLTLLPILVTCLAITGAAGDADWPQWRGPNRTGVSTESGLLKQWPAGGPPVAWAISGLGKGYGTVAVQSDRLYVQGVRTIMTLTSQAAVGVRATDGKLMWRYTKAANDTANITTPVFFNNRVFVTSAYNESDGAFLWQAVTDKLEAGKEQDWPEQGVCSSPAVVGKRLYYVTNRGELVCLDTEGFADGTNDGAFQEEPSKGPLDADVVWKLDMVKELGVVPHNMSNSSPVVWEDLVFVETSNGRAGKELKKIAKTSMGSAVYSTPVPANGVLYIMNRSQLFAIAATPAAPPQ